MRPRSERRRSRRSSPDAPQGAAPVLTVVAGLAVVIAVSVLGWSSSTSTKQPDGHVQSVTAATDPAQQAGTTAPSTTFIRGLGTTTLFVTTTTPITTTTTTSTSSTTSTTVPAGALTADAATVTFAPGQSVATFAVRTTNPDGVGFVLGGVPSGIRATPTSGTARVGAPVIVTLKIVDAATAKSGTITILGANGIVVKVKVNVEVTHAAPSVSDVRATPNPLVCGRSAQLTATVTGSDVRSVVVTLTAGGSGTYPMTNAGSGVWSTTFSSIPATSFWSGNVTARDGSGRSGAQGFSFPVRRTRSC